MLGKNKKKKRKVNKLDLGVSRGIQPNSELTNPPFSILASNTRFEAGTVKLPIQPITPHREMGEAKEQRQSGKGLKALKCIH